MTQPDGAFPTGAANFASLAAFAAKTQGDWESGLHGAEVYRWNKTLAGLFGNMPSGQTFLLTLLSELSKNLLGLDPTTFFASLDDAWNSLSDWAADIFAKSSAQWQAISTQLTALWTLVTSGPVSAAQWAVWWSNFLIAVGLDSASAAAVANFLSGNYDAAKTAKQWLDQFLAAIGVTTGTAAGGVVTGHGTSIATNTAWLTQLGQVMNGQVVTAINSSVQQFKDWFATWTTAQGNISTNTSNTATNTTMLNQITDIFNGLVVTPINSAVQKVKDWFTNQWSFTQSSQARKAKNDDILRDGWHTTYPVGSITDTAATLVGGKRTWWGAFNDNLLLTSQLLGLSPVPATSDADLGTATMLTTATANAAAAAASLASATNQDLTNKIIKASTGVEPANGTPADAYTGLTNFPASNIQGLQGANVNWGATGVGNYLYQVNAGATATVTESHTPGPNDTVVDAFLVVRQTTTSFNPTTSASYNGTPMTFVKRVQTSAAAGNSIAVDHYRIAITPSATPASGTVSGSATPANSSTTGLTVQSVSYNASKIMQNIGNFGASASNFSQSITSATDKRIIAVFATAGYTAGQYGTVTGATQRSLQNVSGANQPPSLWVGDVAGTGSSQTITVSSGTSSSVQWAGFLIELSN